MLGGYIQMGVGWIHTDIVGVQNSPGEEMQREFIICWQLKALWTY